MKFDNYIDYRRSNGPVDTDGYYGFQCMDLWNDYNKEVIELSGDTGADCAKNILNNKYVMENYERIDNYPEFIPKKRRRVYLDRWSVWSCCYMSWSSRLKYIYNFRSKLGISETYC